MKPNYTIEVYNNINNNNINNTELSLVNNFYNLNINAKPFFPKKKLGNINLYNYQNAKNNFKKKINKVGIKNKKNKKKKEFIEKEGDWLCFRCKNINFSFRDKCNKCHLLKEESEKKYFEAGQNLLNMLNYKKN